MIINNFSVELIHKNIGKYFLFIAIHKHVNILYCYFQLNFRCDLQDENKYDKSSFITCRILSKYHLLLFIINYKRKIECSLKNKNDNPSH